MSGWRPLIKGYFAALRLIVGKVMSMRVLTPLLGTCVSARPNSVAPPPHRDRR